jgi:hypothetical protein
MLPLPCPGRCEKTFGPAFAFSQAPPKQPTVPQQLRVVDVGKYNLAVGIVHRGRSNDRAPYKILNRPSVNATVKDGYQSRRCGAANPGRSRLSGGATRWKASRQAGLPAPRSMQNSLTFRRRFSIGRYLRVSLPTMWLTSWLFSLQTYSISSPVSIAECPCIVKGFV